MNRALRIITAAVLFASSPFVGCTDFAQARSVAAPRAVSTLGVLAFPTINVKQQLRIGIADATLARGLGLMPGTVVPGDNGNAVIAGHRTSHGAPMRNIDRLKIGDPIYFTTTGRNPQRYEFRVTKRQVVKADAMWITRPTSNPTLTIFACHPPHSVAYRYVVFARLVTAQARTAA